MKGYLRFTEQPDDSAVTPQGILAPHRARTVQRMQGQADRVLGLMDGSELNYAAHGSCVGLGRIGKNKGSQGTLGLHAHPTLAVTREGLPLGLLRLEIEAPDGRGESAKPPEVCQTQRWVRALADCAAVGRQLDGVRPLAVMDREADIFELFAQQRELGGADLLVRVQHNRCLEQGQTKLFDWIRAEPAQARGEVDVVRLSARRVTSEQAASKLREERTAQVELRWREVRLPAPADGPRRGEEALPLRLVHVAETAAPAGTEALEWFLLTTVEGSSRKQSEEVLQWYRLRWRIEGLFRVLKSGCEVERLAGRKAVWIARALAINAVIAWCLLLLTLLGRDTPELPADLLFSEIEIRLLEDFAQLRRLDRPHNLGKAVLAVAMMGGYLNFRRKRNAAPGAKVLWTGLVRLSTSAQTVGRALALKGNGRVAALFLSD